MPFVYQLTLPSRGPTTPTQCRFGLFPFRSPLLRESIFLSFPPVTKMFQFARLPHNRLCIHLSVILHYQYWVAPFGDLRIIVYVPLPEAFRRLLRPSSAASAKAFTVRPYLLNHLFVFLLSVCLEFCLFNLLLMNSLLQLTL